MEWSFKVKVLISENINLYLTKPTTPWVLQWHWTGKSKGCQVINFSGMVVIWISFLKLFIYWNSNLSYTFFGLYCSIPSMSVKIVHQAQRLLSENGFKQSIPLLVSEEGLEHPSLVMQFNEISLEYKVLLLTCTVYTFVIHNTTKND